MTRKDYFHIKKPVNPMISMLQGHVILHKESSIHYKSPMENYYQSQRFAMFVDQSALLKKKTESPAPVLVDAGYAPSMEPKIRSM